MLLCALSGILTGLTFVFKDLCFLNLFTLIPLIISLKENKKSFLKGVVYAAALNGVTMSFFINMHPMEFLGLTGFKSLGLVFLMYFGVLLAEGLFGGLFIFVFQRYVKNIYLFPIAYMLYEILISLGTFGLTLSDLYLPWYKHTAFIQSASIFGSFFLTLIIVYINLFTLKLIETKKIKYLVFAALIFSSNVIFGAIRLKVGNQEEFNYNIALIQGNISSLEKWESDSLKNTFEVYSNLTLQAKEKYDVDAVIWPETVVNTELNEKSYWYGKIVELAKQAKVDIYLGCFYTGKNGYYNSLVAFKSDGSQYDGVYHKRHLIPFAEKIPFEKGGLTEGREATVINTYFGKIGGLICIDSAYPQLAYKTNKNNCDYFALITNDSWFTDSFGVESHFAHSVFRAVENGKYFLRAGNTGITAVISPFGKAEGIIEPMVRGYTVVKGGKIISEKE